MPPPNVWPVNAATPDPAVIAKAAAVIRAGELVAFPTETVYGLGANALETDAVAKIFAAKGRPASNPVIVHVLDAAQAQSLALIWTDLAAKLATAFWPGPLTLVLRKADGIPANVTAGGDTVALRCPNHPVALALLAAAGVPIAAPSANRSTELSPTRAEHVLKAFNNIPILDGGPCPGGIESTVVDATGEVVRILRPGLIGAERLEAIAGSAEMASSNSPPSPGTMAKHYSPKTPLEICLDDHDLYDSRSLYLAHGQRVGTIRFNDVSDTDDDIILPFNPIACANQLYAKLHEMDNGRFDVILIELPPPTTEWTAIRDRIKRAANA